MLTLGEELVLLALDARRGKLRNARLLQFGLNAAALAELLDREMIALQRADGDRGLTLDAAVGTPVADPALKRIWKRAEQAVEGGRRPHPDDCVKYWPDPSLHFYLRTLKERGILRWDAPKRSQNRNAPRERYGRFRLLDAEAASAARAAVERVRSGAGPTPRDRDLAGIAARLGLGETVYPGMLGHAKRAGLERATETQRFALILGRVLPTAELEFVFNSSGDLAMARDLMRAAAFDFHHHLGG